MEFLIIAILLAYLIGSIPFGLILTRMAGLGDIRQIGSGNIGATNVLRTGKKWLALATLVLDFGKAFAAVSLLPEISAEPTYGVIPLACILGHMFPIWLKFKGGKGVACLFGIGFALSYTLGIWMAICWLTMFAIYRYSSLGALIGIPAGIIIASQNEAVQDEPFMMMIPTLLMIAKHHENIRRLVKGEESRFTFTSKSPTSHEGSSGGRHCRSERPASKAHDSIAAKQKIDYRVGSDEPPRNDEGKN